MREIRNAKFGIEPEGNKLLNGRMGLKPILE
jgi:hypothetical protein